VCRQSNQAYTTASNEGRAIVLEVLFRCYRPYLGRIELPLAPDRAEVSSGRNAARARLHTNYILNKVIWKTIDSTFALVVTLLTNNGAE